MTALGILWFFLVFLLIAIYFALDGFDLGVGVLYPVLGKTDDEKSVLRTSIAPVWDGNEVWLLTAGGALFAAFPAAYATSFSGFYLAIMLVLFGLIIRAVCLEFRAHEEKFAKVLDWGFVIGSFLPALLFGVAVGNILEGLPLNANGDYTGTFFALLNPFALVCGVLGLVHMLTQGAAWIAAKAPAGTQLQASAAALRKKLAIADIIVFVLATAFFFLLVKPQMPYTVGTAELPVLFAVLFLVGTLGAGFGKKDVLCVVLLGVAAAGLVGIFGATMFPNLIPAVDVANAITVATAASGDTTLRAMTIIACIGVPLVLVYHIIVYRAFRGRVKLEDGRY